MDLKGEQIEAPGPATTPFDGSAFIPTFKWDPSFDFNDYELGPGDILNFHMWGSRAYNTKVYVSATYQVFIPFIGPLDVRHVTLAGLNKVMNRELSKYFKNASAICALQRPREFFIEISGAVVSPGQKPANALMRLHEFLEKSGGLRQNASSISIAIYSSASNEPQYFNLQDYLLNGSIPQNPFLKDGDRIFVPFEKNVAFVFGNIMRPGRFEFEQPEILLKDLVEKHLGGFSKTNRTGGEVVISRIEADAPKTYSYSTQSFFNTTEKVNYENFVVRNGDQITFPVETANRPFVSKSIFVTGEVKASGPIPFEPGLPIQSYISMAGGISPRADYDEAVVYKASGSKEKVSENPPLESGDTIYVPERTFKFWQDHLAILTTFLTVVTTTIAITR